MKFSNFHTHCFFCDGKGEPEVYIKKAIELNFSAIGFSSHAPMHIPSKWNMRLERLEEYLKKIKALKIKYKDTIEVYCGLEVDYFDKQFGVKTPSIKDLNLDYVLGSVHYMKNTRTGEYLTVDGSEEDYKRIIDEFFDGRVESFVGAYYSLLRNMVEEHRPDIVGHIDLIKKNNRDNKYFNEKEQWYREEVFKTLKHIKKFDCILEINTGGISRGYMRFPYPSEWILMECKKLDIKLMLNADAHSPDNLDTYFAETINILKDVGISKLYTMSDSKWISNEIND